MRHCPSSCASYYVIRVIPVEFTVGINREARPRLNATRNRRPNGALRPRERRFRLIFGGRESILIAVREISFRPCSDADWSIGTRTRPRAPTGYQKNRKDLPACAPMEGAIFIRTPHFIFCRPLFRVLFLSVPSVSLSFSLPDNTLHRRVFLAGSKSFSS